ERKRAFVPPALCAGALEAFVARATARPWFGTLWIERALIDAVGHVVEVLVEVVRKVTVANTRVALVRIERTQILSVAAEVAVEIRRASTERVEVESQRQNLGVGKNTDGLAEEGALVLIGTGTTQLDPPQRRNYRS